MRAKNVLMACGAGAVLAGASVANAGILDVIISGSVGATNLTRGPFVGAAAGNDVTITFSIDTDNDIGFGDFHRYNTIGYTVTVNGVSMTASVDPTFGFTAFSTFSGFDNASTGLLMPGGGTDHEYRIPVFSASGPETIWAPQGSTPDDHLGTFGAGLFDFLGDNRVLDAGAGGAGRDQQLLIRFESIEIVPTPSTLALVGLGGLVATRRRRQA